MTPTQSTIPIQYLLTLPPRMAAEFEELEGRRRPEWFAASDPPGPPLGSGGGTANLLAQAWRRTPPANRLTTGCGKAASSFSMPAARAGACPPTRPTGKLLMPIPVFRWARGQRLDQSLLDLQLPDYQRVLAHAGSGVAAMVTSGDVLLRFARELPPFPEVDVLGLGMWVAPERRKDFGVFFVAARPAHRTGVFPPETVRRQNPRTGGELSLPGGHGHVAVERAGGAGADGAVRLGRAESAIRRRRARAATSCMPSSAWRSGKSPPCRTRRSTPLTCAVVPLPEAQFYHFGTSRADDRVGRRPAKPGAGRDQDRPGRRAGSIRTK